MGQPSARWAREMSGTVLVLHRHSTKKDEGTFPDEITAMPRLYLKHATGFTAHIDDAKRDQTSLVMRPVQDADLRETVTVVSRASERKCGKRLNAALAHLVESTACRGDLQLDRPVAWWLLVAGVSTLDRLLNTLRTTLSTPT